MPRLPDFLVIGAMKSGTTTLHEMLAAQPDIFMPARKEPHFFSQDWVWERGSAWYADLFRGAGSDQVIGEASTSYSDPDYSVPAASRIAEMIPGIRLVFVVRHPLDRLRSDYDHEFREGRESAPFADVVASPGSAVAVRSQYHSCLAPYRRYFDRERFCVVRFEDLVAPGSPAFATVIDHLGLPPRAAPVLGARNAATDIAASPTLMRLLRRRNLLGRARALPAPVRRFARRAVGRRPAVRVSYAVPDVIADRIWADVAAFEAWLGVAEPLWPRSDGGRDRRGGA